MPEGKSFTRFFPIIARVLMGLLFTMTGLNGFLNFLPQPKEAMPEFAVALAKTGYMFPMIMGTQLLCGLLFLSGRFVPLALALLAPVVVNIVAFHLFLAQNGIAMAMVVLLLELYLAGAYRGAFKPMLAMNAAPGTNSGGSR
ncbi:MAG: DoxX family membrane protein [Planctomycetes bacterium]|nr:DoxX family membrane protein [Planctomycetota bacterium]